MNLTSGSNHGRRCIPTNYCCHKGWSDRYEESDAGIIFCPFNHLFRTSKFHTIDRESFQVNITADHRVIYGADLAAFLQTLAKIIEDPKDLTF